MLGIGKERASEAPTNENSLVGRSIVWGNTCSHRGVLRLHKEQLPELNSAAHSTEPGFLPVLPRLHSLRADPTRGV